MVSEQGSLTLQDLLKRGEWNKARAVLEAQIEKEPDNRQWRLVHASVLIKQGRAQEAEKALVALTQTHPDFPEAWINLGQLYKALHHYQLAWQAFEQVLRLDPEQPLARRGAAECSQAMGDNEAALPHWHALIARQQDDPEIWLQLANCQVEREPRAAIDAAERALALRDDDLRAVHVLGKARINNGEFEAALPLFEQLAGYGQWHAAGLQGKIACLLYMGECEPALPLLDEFLQAGGNQADAAMMRAKAHVQLGNTEDAVEAYRTVLSLDLLNVDAWFGLLTTSPQSADERQVAVLEDNWERLPSAEGKRLAAFALARWHESRRALSKQMCWLDRANVLQERLRPFSAPVLRGGYRLTQKVCSSAWFSQVALDVPADDLTPVLICGMPRSGTTLVEQILSAHPDVTARGENRAHILAVHQLAATLGSDELEVFLRSVNRDRVQTFRDAYAKQLREEEGVDTPWFTSKAMDLVLKLGLIIAAYPNARVIQLCRHPLDVGLGCYKQYFSQGQTFSNSWAGIAAYYAEFHRLMAHWATIFPKSILPVRYEELVDNPRSVTEQLAAHCGLKWREEMLRFHENKAVVTTASATQVRQGLFRSAAGRWGQYGALLNPLKQALEREGIDWEAYDNNKR